jgi:chemotaxis response regulator CheB
MDSRVRCASRSVEDSVVVRRLLGDALRADPAIEVAGIAPNGQIALSRLPQLAPDLVTLDLEMPDTVCAAARRSAPLAARC